jgi:hypothetical protein
MIPKISNHKIQITNKSQYSNFQRVSLIVILYFEFIWDLVLGTWDLASGAWSLELACWGGME